MPSNEQPSNDKSSSEPTSPVFPAAEQMTNEQRRADAKRKLEQRLETQQQAARKRKIIIVSSSVIVVLVVAAAVTTLVVNKVLDDREKARYTACAYTPTPPEANPFAQATPQIPPNLPAAQQALAKEFVDNFTAGKAKQRTATTPADRELKKGELTATFTTSQGPITMTLDRGQAPCNVAAVTSLIKQKYYDNTTCHRMTEGGQGKIAVLQCGDPTGTGAGAPGWTSPDEFPTNLKVIPQSEQLAAMGLPNSVIYPRGTVAIANGYRPGQGGQASGTNTGSAQMFLVINDSELPANYSVIGKVGADGLKVLDTVYKGGITPGVSESQDPNTGAATFVSTPGDGRPKLPVDIKTVTVS